VSRSQILAARYDVHVSADGIADARKILGISAVWPPPMSAPAVDDSTAEGSS
jgi:hypothetical protein